MNSRYAPDNRWGCEEAQYSVEQAFRSVERRAMETTTKRKSFKGGAPKRARYSLDPTVSTTWPAYFATFL